jgi:DNA polymerase III alpha subunit
MEDIVAARRDGGPFLGLADFLRRVPIPRREAEALILAGAFDDIPPPPGMVAPPNHPQLLWALESSAIPSSRSGAAVDRRERGGLDPGPIIPDACRGGRKPEASGGGRRLESTRDGEPACGDRGEARQAWLILPGDAPRYPPLPPYDAMTRIRNELEILELAITDHPMRILRDEARERGCLTTVEAAGRLGERVRVAGIVAATRKVRTQRGGLMQFLTVEDEHGLLESTLFPRVYQAFAGRIRSLGPYIVEGKVEEDHRAVNLIVARIEAWSRPGDDLPEPAPAEEPAPAWEEAV